MKSFDAHRPAVELSIDIDDLTSQFPSMTTSRARADAGLDRPAAAGRSRHDYARTDAGLDMSAAAGRSRHDFTTAEVNAMAQPGACTHFTLNGGTPFARPGGRKPAAGQLGASSSEGVGAVMRGEPPVADTSRSKKSRQPGSIGDVIAPDPSAPPPYPLVHFTLVGGVSVGKSSGGRSNANRPGSANPILGDADAADPHRSGRKHFSEHATTPTRDLMQSKGKPTAADTATVVGSLLRGGAAADGSRRGEVLKHDYRVTQSRPPPRSAY